MTKKYDKRVETINALKALERMSEKNQGIGIPFVALHSECALKLAQDGLELLEQTPESCEPIGTINTNKYALRTHIGKGETDDGKEFEICVQLNHAPFVRYGKKTFNLTWNDIVTLAERAGLFTDEVAE